MKTITHNEQQEAWEKEHENTQLLTPMDQKEPSASIPIFWEWLTRHNADVGSGIEMGCGKGRNSIWLAQQGVAMTGFDFSSHAIQEAKKRAQEAGVKKNLHLLIHDAIKPWPFKPETFDIGFDIFASTDIESAEGRVCARDELIRVVKKGGYVLVYTLSSESEFHKSMALNNPAAEEHAFVHPSSNKFEKAFTLDEIKSFYGNLELIEAQTLHKSFNYRGKEYYNHHNFWLIFKKK